MKARVIVTVLAAMALGVLLLAVRSRRESPEIPRSESPQVERRSVTPAPAKPPPESTLSVVEQPLAPQPETNRLRPNYSLRSDDDEPGSNVLSWDRVKTNPQYAVRVTRHMAIKHLLSSDAARTAEGKQIIALCRAYNYEPWTVSGAYTIAWEYSKVRSDNPADRPNFELIGAEARTAEIQYDLGFHFSPEFMEQVKQVWPTKAFGRDYGIGVSGETLLDEATWADIPTDIATELTTSRLGTSVP
jgi:hypothetical protein